MNTRTITPIAALALLAGHALAQTPHVDDGGMVHVGISYDGTTIDAHMDTPGFVLPLTQYPGETYAGAASVLNETYYSSRYGFLPSGFITLDQGQSIWVERVGATAGLNAYAGGMRMMAASHTYAPIFTSDGAIWQWSGTMHHPWFAVAAPGSYEMTLRFYVGDSSGVPVAGTFAGEETLHFIAVPAPAGAFALAGGAFAAARRRRV